MKRSVVLNRLGGATALSLLFTTTGWATTGPVQPQPQQQPTVREALGRTMAEKPGEAMPADRADLDRWLKAKDYPSIIAALRIAHTEDDVLRNMNWEQVQIYNGASVLISFIYMSDLWRLGSALPPPHGDEMKQTAVAVGLYAYEEIALDGPSCGDPSAPAHHHDQLIADNQPVWAFGLALPEAQRTDIVKVALAMEQGALSVRGPDSVLCSGGLSEIQQGLAAQGDKPLPQVANRPGAVGKTFKVPDVPAYHPDFKPDAAWRPQQAAARAKMPALLLHLMKLDQPAAPAAPAAPN